jgi:uncharacterized protein (TIGR03546 family)
MVIYFIRALRAILSIFVEDCSIKQISAAIAIGMMLGLMPKGNLLATAIAIGIFALRVNIGAAFLSAFAFSFAGALTDGIAAGVGGYILEHPSLHSTWQTLYATPFVPWTNFNHVSVMGNLVLGILFCYPIYRISIPIVTYLKPIVTDRLFQYRVFRFLSGADEPAKEEMA